MGSNNAPLEETIGRPLDGSTIFIPTDFKIHRQVRHDKFGKIMQIGNKKGVWVSKDTAGHGGSVWKMFEDRGKALKWLGDLDEYGRIIENKHKSSMGVEIPWKELH